MVIHYGDPQLTRDCLSSLWKHCRQRLCAMAVVLNAPLSEEQKNAVQGEMPVVWVGRGENLGFAAGANYGAREAIIGGATDLLFLNNDTQTHEDWLSPLSVALDRGYGLVAPVILDWDGRIVLSGGGSYSPWRANTIVDGAGLPWPQGRQKIRGVNEATALHEAEFLCGCALLIPTTVWQAVGGFAEETFLYFEDTELCQRLRRQGYRLATVLESSVRHRVAASSGGEKSPVALYYHFRNRVWFLLHHVSGRAKRLCGGTYLAGALLLKSALWFAKRRLDLVGAAWQGIADGLAGVTGRTFPREVGQPKADDPIEHLQLAQYARLAETRSLEVLLAQLGIRLSSFIYFLVIATQGAFLAGQVVFCFAVFEIIAALVENGLSSVAMREIARNPQTGRGQLIAGGLIRMGLAILCWLVLALVLMGGTVHPDTRWGCLLLVGGQLAVAWGQSLKAVMLGYHRLRAVQLLCFAVVFSSVCLGSLGILWQASVYWFLGILAAWTLVDLLVTWIYYHRTISPTPGSALCDLSSVLRMAIPLGISLLAMTAYYRLDTVLLTVLGGEEEAGIYNGAWRLILALLLVCGMTFQTLTPAFSRAYQQNELASFLRRVLTATALASLGACICAYLAAPWIIAILYGGRFSASTTVLQILALAIPVHLLSLLLLHLGNALSPVTARQMMWVVLAVLGLNTATNLWLLPASPALTCAYIRVGCDILLLLGIVFVLMRLAAKDTSRFTE